MTSKLTPKTLIPRIWYEDVSAEVLAKEDFSEFVTQIQRKAVNDNHYTKEKK